jgi:hypothetical protein
MATNSCHSGRRCNWSVLCHPNTVERLIPAGSRSCSSWISYMSFSFNVRYLATLNLQMEVGNQLVREPAALRAASRVAPVASGCDVPEAPSNPDSSSVRAKISGLELICLLPPRCGWAARHGRSALALSRAPQERRHMTATSSGRYTLMIHFFPGVPCLTMLTWACVAKTRASPCRDTIEKDLARRHTKRVSFGQGPMTSVRVELWGSRTLNCRYWAGLLHCHLLAVEFFLPLRTPR